MKDDEIHLHDNADAFFRARARMLRDHQARLSKRLSSTDITTWERVAVRKSIENDETHAQYWEEKAKHHKPQF